MKLYVSRGISVALTGLLILLAGCAGQQKSAAPEAKAQAAPAAAAMPSSTVVEGKKLAIEFCQACHYFEGTDQAGTVAPPLLVMKQRFPERQKLEKIIWDPQVASKPDTMMPPFGRNGLLDEKQIALIIDFLYTL